MSKLTLEEAKRLFREAYQSLGLSSKSIDIVKLVAAKQDALTAGVSVRELQAIEDEVGRQQTNA